MALGSSRPSKWFIVFCLLFGVSLGFVTASIAMSFWSVFAGEGEHRGLFILIWMVAALVFFAWPMHIVERAYAIRRQRRIMRDRIGDLDYEPSILPILGSRASGPKDERDEVDEIHIKAPDIERRGFKTLLSGGRTAEQRMADHLKTLELKAEIQRAQESKAEDRKRPTPPD